MSKHFLYTLVFDCDPEPVVFYVGHTKDPKRREAEHRLAARDVRNTEYKYQWCRELAAVDTAWDFVVVGEIEDDEDSEYAWILRFARRNQDLGLSFIDGLPLTNMKAGDFLDEILADRTISTREEIRAYRQQRSRAVNYQRVKPTKVAQGIIDAVMAAAEQSRIEQEQQNIKKRIKQAQQIEKAAAEAAARELRIREETERLMAEYHQQDLNKQAMEELLDPNNLLENPALAEVIENARLLGQYIQTIEETKPNSAVLPEAYTQLAKWRAMKAALQMDNLTG